MLGRPPHPYTLADAKGFVARVSDPARTSGEVGFAITLAEDGVFLGGIGYGPRGEAGEIELGYWLGRPYWGRGYASEAARAVAAHAFEAGHAALSVSCRVENDASRRVIEKLGAAFVGAGELDSLPLGRRVPTRLYRLTAEDLKRTEPREARRGGAA